jgi:hypothetical protein
MVGGGGGCATGASALSSFLGELNIDRFSAGDFGVLSDETAGLDEGCETTVALGMDLIGWPVIAVGERMRALVAILGEAALPGDLGWIWVNPSASSSASTELGVAVFDEPVGDLCR